MRSPASPDFSGWNCTPPTCACSTAAANGSPCAGRRTCARGHGRRVRVREVHVDAVVQPFEQRRRASDAERIPPDVGDLQCARAIVEPRARALQHAQPARSPAPPRCPRTATACRGRSRSSGRPASTPARMASLQAASSDAVAPKCPTPGTTTPDAPARSPGARASSSVGTGRRETLPHGGQVPGAVVDERDHHDTMTDPAAGSASVPVRPRHQCGRAEPDVPQGITCSQPPLR